MLLEYFEAIFVFSVHIFKSFSLLCMILEKLILKHGVAAQADNVKQVHKNVDFFFANKSHASKFVSFFGQCGANFKSR